MESINSTYNSTWITNESTTMDYYFYSYDCDVSCVWCGSCEPCIEKGCTWNHEVVSCDKYGRSGQSNKCTYTNPVLIFIIIVASLFGLIVLICIIYYVQICKSNEKHKNNGFNKTDVEMEGYQGNTETIEMNGEQQISNEPIKQVVYVPESHGNPTQIQAMVQHGSQINANEPNSIPFDDVPPPAYSNN
mmetsp:Transcript_32027/g.39332  ORF Transcript_32027/g.39332 Transcript_32027/m.39332 type:complete len:189 (+) Transcript_32027:42-608(+)